MRLESGRCLLREVLRRRGMTQQELSIATGMSESQVSDYVRERFIMSLETAATFAYVIGCAVEDLYEWDCTER